MRLLLADEHFPFPSVKELHSAGHDVYAIAESDFSISDEKVIAKAITEDRSILTFDKDFGELIFKNGYRPPAGVIFFRWEHYQPNAPGTFLLSVSENEKLSFEFKMTVIDEENIRQRVY